MYEVEYIWKGWVRKDRVNVNPIQYDCPDFRSPIDFAVSPRLSVLSPTCFHSTVRNKLLCVGIKLGRSISFIIVSKSNFSSIRIDLIYSRGH